MSSNKDLLAQIKEEHCLLFKLLRLKNKRAFELALLFGISPDEDKKIIEELKEVHNDLSRRDSISDS